MALLWAAHDRGKAGGMYLHNLVFIPTIGWRGGHNGNVPRTP
jgi:hypothetical protein